MKPKIFIVFLMVLFLFDAASAYDDEDTHPRVTQNAVEKSILNGYLIQNFDVQFQQGIESIISGKSVKDWLRKGSTAEDSPLCRASNHFHNPLKSWDQSYVTDDPWWFNLDVICAFSKPFYSSVTWGTGYLSPTGPKIIINNQDMGWDSARNYYFNALTAQTSAERETNFALTFQSLKFCSE